MLSLGSFARVAMKRKHNIVLGILSDFVQPLLLQRIPQEDVRFQSTDWGLLPRDRTAKQCLARSLRLGGVFPGRIGGCLSPWQKVGDRAWHSNHFRLRQNVVGGTCQRMWQGTAPPSHDIQTLRPRSFDLDSTELGLR
jgi:hypothetical protein